MNFMCFYVTMPNKLLQSQAEDPGLVVKENVLSKLSLNHSQTAGVLIRRTFKLTESHELFKRHSVMSLEKLVPKGCHEHWD